MGSALPIDLSGTENNHFVSWGTENYGKDHSCETFMNGHESTNREPPKSDKVRFLSFQDSSKPL